MTKKKIWTKEKDSLLRRLYPTAHLGSLAARLGVTLSAVKNRANVLGLKRQVNKNHPWTERQIAYLTKHYADTPIEVLIVKTKHNQKSIWNKARALGLRKSLEFLQAVGRHCSQHPKSVATRFVKGHEPSNKGKRIVEFMSKEGIEASSRTRYKKGHRPHNTRSVGSECQHADGYVYLKVGEGKPVLKHRYVWEQANGPIPDGHCIAFRDGNRANCDLSNLYLLSREESGRRCTQNENPEARRKRIEKAQETRNKSIRRDKIRLHWGLEPLGKIVKRW